jgi:hypothetical protein
VEALIDHKTGEGRRPIHAKSTQRGEKSGFVCRRGLEAIIPVPGTSF